MTISRRNFLKTGVGFSVLPYAHALPAAAAGSDTLVAVTAQTINSLDLHRTGTNRASYAVANAMTGW